MDRLILALQSSPPPAPASSLSPAEGSSVAESPSASAQSSPVPESSSSYESASSAVESSSVPESSLEPQISTPGISIPQPGQPQVGVPLTGFPWLWVALAVLLALVAFFFFRKRKKIPSTPAPSSVLLPDPANSTREESGVRIANFHHIGKRESQQDSFGVSDLSNKESGILAVVADGMGGISGGAEISAIVTSYMLSAHRRPAREPDIGVQLLHLVTEANTEARLYLKKNGNQISGSTVVSVIIKDGCMHFISVGDSRICLLREGVLLTLNREHTYGSQLDEQAARGEIPVGEARSDPQRASLTSFIGMPELTQIDRSLRPVTLVPGDVVLLMSDGVFGTLTDDEIVSVLASGDIYQDASAMEQAVLKKQKGNQDNFTAVLIAV